MPYFVSVLDISSSNTIETLHYSGLAYHQQHKTFVSTNDCQQCAVSELEEDESGTVNITLHSVLVAELITQQAECSCGV